MKIIYSLGAALILIALPGCSHRSPADTDLFNESATIAAARLPFNPFQWKIIATGIDPPHQTMSALYGNDLAVESARSGNHAAYPDGSVLSLVTWSLREDPHWFGARIPGPIQSIEFVTLGGKNKDQMAASYQRYEGPQLQPAANQDVAAVEARKNAILMQRAAVMP
jgi:Cytochrome P460